MSRVICPGRFDPVTVGHIDIISRASKMFDEVIVAVLVNVSKKPSASLENVEVVGFDGLLADYAKQCKATAIVKGLRAVSDFEYEFQMSLTNKKLNPDLETIFLTTSSEYMYLSSSIVKQIAQFGGDITPFVAPCIKDEIVERLCKNRNII